MTSGKIPPTPRTNPDRIFADPRLAEIYDDLDGDRDDLDLDASSVLAMTGNVAQIFLADHEWASVLTAARHALGVDGRLVFETRDPAFRGWEECATPQIAHTENSS